MPLPIPEPVIENEKGKIEILPGDAVQSLSWGTWTFRWTPGFDVIPGGGLEIVLVPRFQTNRWSLPQTADPIAPGYVTVKTPDGVIAERDVLRWPLFFKPHGATLHIIQIALGGRTVGKGEAVEVVYGDQRGGSLGTQVQLSARVVAFPVFVSSGQDHRFFERFVSWDRHTDIATLRVKADFNPSLMVTGGRAENFHVVAPLEVEPEKPFTLRFSVLDQGCNAAAGYEGVVEFRATDSEARVPPAVTVKGSKAEIGGISLVSEGFHRIYVIDPNRGILGVSNPIRVRENARSVFWGEIHAHSEQSDGNGTPDEHYTYGRDTALLDFGCVCDHDETLYQHPDRWKTASDKVREYTEEGKFVAILGYEGRLMENRQGQGDINIYYGVEEAEMLEAFAAPMPKDVTDGKTCIIVPHTPPYGKEGTRMGTEWRFLEGITPDSMPLVEVFSTHGNSEYYDCPRHLIWQDRGHSVVDALKLGFRLGFIGSSDYHEVLLGSLLRIQDTPRTINNRHMQARCGLAAVLADDLSRRKIFEAMKERKTFATSGIRGYVEFSVNGSGMGTEITIGSPDTPRILGIAAAAPERIEKCEVIRGGEVIADLSDGNWFIEAEIEDSDPVPDGTFYYLRVTTERTDFLWSSPIWVDLD